MPEKKSISAFYEPQRFDDDDIMKFMNQEIPDLYDILDKKNVRANNEAISGINEVKSKQTKRSYDDETQIREDILSFKEQFPDASPEEFDNFVMQTVAGTGNVSTYSKLKSDRALSDARKSAEKRNAFGMAKEAAKFDVDAANDMLRSYGLDGVDLSGAQDVNVPTVGRVRPKKGGGFDVLVPAREPKEKEYKPVIMINEASGDIISTVSPEEERDLVTKGYIPQSHLKAMSDLVDLQFNRQLTPKQGGAAPAPTPTPTPEFIARRRK